MNVSIMENDERVIDLAIVSPSRNLYSETFIEQHKHIPNVRVSYYYDGGLPAQLEGKGALLVDSFLAKAGRGISGLLSNDDTAIHRAIEKSFRLRRISCVLAEYGPTGVQMLPICQRTGIPLIVHFHGFDASVTKVVDRYRKDYLRLFDYASTVVVVSKVMHRTLKDMGCPDSKLLLNPYGPDPTFFEVETNYAKPRFVAVGRFVDKKAPYYTLLAFQKVVKDFPQSELVFFGDGPLLAACKNLVQYYDLEDRVVFKGAHPRESIQESMTEAIGFVQHSIRAENGDMEGTPVGILEAMAAGLPVVSTRHAGIPDVVVEGETGFLVDEHDVMGMGASMMQLAADKSLCKRMGRQGREHVQKHFSLDGHLAKLGDAITTAVNGRH